MFYRLLKIAGKIIIPILFKVSINGRENMEEEGPLIISSNHTSFYDPMFISLMIDRKIHFLAKMELCHHRLTNWFFKKLYVIPVDRHNGMVIRPVRKTLRLLQEGKVVGIFPEGTRIPNGEKAEPKKGVAFFGVKSDVSILPVAITLYKEKHWFRQKAVINIGSPIDVSSLETNNYRELAQQVMQRSRDLIPRQETFDLRKEYQRSTVR